MRVLAVDAYPPSDPDRAVVDAAIESLVAGGHEVDRLTLADDPAWAGFMTAEERLAYETDEPLQAEATRAAADRLRRCESLLFCYPTVLFGVPPILKSWLERVMVLGVAFRFDDNQRIRPGLVHVRRLGVVTTSPHGRLATWRARDRGHRTIMRTLRLNCHRRCRSTFVRLPTSGVDNVAVTARRLRRWR